MFPATNKFKSFQLKSQMGQGIIEIVVVLGLAAILILSLVALSVRSNRSANFSKAEDQAARYAQEGMEYLRNMRDSGLASVTLTGCAASDWTCIFPTNFPGDEIATLCSSGCLDFNGTSEPITSGGRSFERRVIVRDNVIPGNPCNLNGNASAAIGDWDEIKQFTVEVTWNDTAGAHTSTTNSCLAR